MYDARRSIPNGDVGYSDEVLISRHADLIAGNGSKPITRAIVRNSITSSRRSRPSTLAT